MDSNNNQLCLRSRKMFIMGFAAAVKSVLDIAKQILLKLSFKYLLTYKFSQDSLGTFLCTNWRWRRLE